MKRKIVSINDEKCIGCGLCVDACHVGALKLIDGKVKLVSDSYCDGLDSCLPECPVDAITIEEKEVVAFDEEAVKKHLTDKMETAAPSAKPTASTPEEQQHCDCPESYVRIINRQAGKVQEEVPAASVRVESQLGQWPCQIKLVPVNALYFDNAHFLVAVDCTAYAYAGVHRDFMKGKITIIGCPKLDESDYSQKLAQILASHYIKSITVLRMEVPYCGGIVNAVKNALMSSGKLIPWNVVTISTEGSIIEV